MHGADLDGDDVARLGHLRLLAAAQHLNGWALKATKHARRPSVKESWPGRLRRRLSALAVTRSPLCRASAVRRCCGECLEPGECSFDCWAVAACVRRLRNS